MKRIFIKILAIIAICACSANSLFAQTDSVNIADLRAISLPSWANSSQELRYDRKGNLFLDTTKLSPQQSNDVLVVSGSSWDEFQKFAHKKKIGQILSIVGTVAEVSSIAYALLAEGVPNDRIKAWVVLQPIALGTLIPGRVLVLRNEANMSNAVDYYEQVRRAHSVSLGVSATSVGLLFNF